MADGLTYDELAAFMEKMPRIPRYELHCGSDVQRWLQRFGAATVGLAFPYFEVPSMLGGIPVYPEPDFEPGRWEIRQDGEVIKEGKLW